MGACWSSLETVSVEIERGWHTAYIALGSNMGDKEQYLNQAVKSLNEASCCKVAKVSSFLVTPPYGVTDQDDFLNACLELRTLLTPRELLDELHRIEKEAGRERIIHWGPRTLDLDIIFYDDLILHEEDFCIPHVEVQKRDFVLKPLHEIAPCHKHHPCSHKTVREMLEEPCVNIPSSTQMKLSSSYTRSSSFNASPNSSNCFVSTRFGAAVIRQEASFTFGNAITSRMLSSLAISITRRSSP